MQHLPVYVTPDGVYVNTPPRGWAAIKGGIRREVYEMIEERGDGVLDGSAVLAAEEGEAG